MGKTEDEHLPLQSTILDAQGTTSSTVCNHRVNFRCVLVLGLGVGVLLYAVFGLPFFKSGDHNELDLDYGGHDITASFMVQRPASFVEENKSQLKDDIFGEMSYTSTSVDIISLQSSDDPNTTKVVFAVDDADITTQSLIKSSFMYLIVHQSSLQLSSSLFGDSFAFELLRFKGGITAIPDQKGFTLQKVQIGFNFTLNSSIHDILDSFAELTSQLRTGLHLAPYENLYIKLNNIQGSTVAPPTTIESRVLLAVGISPSEMRSKQLARSITGGSHAKNLGLNNTVFGWVKQVRLSSALPRSSRSDGDVSAPTPSPPPRPQSHHHNPSNKTPAPISSAPPRANHLYAPAPAPAPAPTPVQAKNKSAPPPTHRFGNNDSAVAPSAHRPVIAPRNPRQTNSPPPERSPVPTAKSLVSYAPSPCTSSSTIIWCMLSFLIMVSIW